jgi:signal transduction histidine kinase
MQDGALVPSLERELAERSVSAAIGASALALTLAICAACLSDISLSVLFVPAGAVCAFAIARALLSRAFLAGRPGAAPAWRKWFSPSLIAAAVAWASLLSAILASQGFGHPASQLTMIVVSGLSAGALSSLAAAPRLFTAYIAIILLGPQLAVLFAAPGRDTIAIPIACCLFFAFLQAQAGVYLRTLRQSFLRERQIERDRDVLQTVLDTVPGYISCINKAGEYVAMNQALRDRLGLSGRDRLSETLGGRDGDAPWILAYRRFLQGEDQAATLQGQLFIGGEPRWHMMCFRKSADKQWGVWISLDIHQEYLLQAEAAKQRESLLMQEKMSSLGEMASGIAHEINNPLAIIGAVAARARRSLETPPLDSPAILADLDKIVATINRIAKIVKGLRAFSRNAENDPLAPAPIAEVIEESLTLTRDRFAASGIKLRADVAAVEGALVDCRPSQLSQVLLNLLANAYDAIEALPERWIELSATATAERVEIAVIDSGNGIPEPIARRLMEPFFSTKEVGKGTGLGLSISKGIVEDHGGQIFYDSSAPHTTFRIWLPRSAPLAKP